jgi:hypothetical protein
LLLSFYNGKYTNNENFFLQNRTAVFFPKALLPGFELGSSDPRQVQCDHVPNEIDYLKRFNLRHSGRRHLPEEPGVPERATLPQDVGAEGGLRHAAEGHRVHDRQVKGCQICLGPNIPKLGKIYQMATNYTKLP